MRLAFLLVLATLSVIAAYVLLRDGESVPANTPLPGDPWDGTPRYGLSQQEAETFQDFPLFWLGPSFAGYNLQGIVHQVAEMPPPGPHATGNQATLVYGTCKLSGGREPSCSPLPLILEELPVCEEGAFLPAVEPVRGGALMRRVEEHGGEPAVGAQIWTGRTMIIVLAYALPSRIDEIVDRLESLSAEEGIAAGYSLPPPDFSACS